MKKRMWKLGLILMVSCAILALTVIIGCDNGEDEDPVKLPALLAHYALTKDLKDSVSNYALYLTNLREDNGEVPDPLYVELKDYAPGKQALFFSGGSGWFAPCGAAQGLFHANGDKVEHLETFTMAAWVKVYDELFESGGAIFGSGGMGYDDVGALLTLIADGEDKFLALDVGWEIWSPEITSVNGGEYGQAFVPIPKNVNWNQWVHFAVTYNHTTNIVTFYLNGELLGTDRYKREDINPDELEAFTGPNFSQSGSLMRIHVGADMNYWLENGGKLEMFNNLTATLVIGARQDWGPIGNIFEGWIQDCRLYAEVLTAKQIKVVKDIVTP